MVEETSQTPNWMEVSLTTSGEVAEALAEVLGRFAINGVVIESITWYNKHEEEHQPTGEMRVYGYLPFDAQYESVRQKMEEALWHLGQITPLPQPVYSPVHDQNWMAAWRKHYQPIPIGKKLIILPSWIEEQDPSRIAIRIDPAMAFGTGTHPSTQLCLLLMENQVQADTAVIDVGCGSGILSIAALKLGAGMVLGVDTDAVAVTSTRENAHLNQVETKIQVKKGSIETILAGQFSIHRAPLVLANILAPVIISLFDQGLADLGMPGAKFILAGILSHQADQVIKVAENKGLKLLDQRSIEDWTALLMQKM